MSDELKAKALDLATAYLTRNPMEPGEVPKFLRSLIEALEVEPGGEVPTGPTPPVAIEDSVQHDHLICLEDGQPVKALKRYLSSRFGMTPEEYRAKWGLPADYPMVSPAYSEARRQIALKQGLGKTVS